MTLEPIKPETAVDLYLTDRANEVAEKTIQSHRSRLSYFVDWCEENEIENLNELSGRDMHEYRVWRREAGDLAPVSEKTQMDTLRVFVQWLETIDAVEPDLHTRVRSPLLSNKENVRDVMLEPDRAEEILAYLDKYEYASRRHVVFALLWHTMMRVGAVHALDVQDYDPHEQRFAVVHRPEADTPIKNQNEGERYVAVADDVAAVVEDWLEMKRPDVTDDHGRKPLVATEHGRAHQSTLRADCYRLTRPCVLSGECPHDRDLETCEAREYGTASRCPSAVSPHALRRGGITYALNSK